MVDTVEIFLSSSLIMVVCHTVYVGMYEVNLGDAWASLSWDGGMATPRITPVGSLH